MQKTTIRNKLDKFINILKLYNYVQTEINTIMKIADFL